MDDKIQEAIKEVDGVEVRTRLGDSGRWLRVCHACGADDPDNNCDGCGVELCDAHDESCPDQRACIGRWKALNRLRMLWSMGICPDCDRRHAANE